MPTSHRSPRAGKTDGAVKIIAAVIGGVSVIVVALLNRPGSDPAAAPTQPNVVVNVNNHNEQKNDAQQDRAEIERLRARLEAAEARLNRDEGERNLRTGKKDEKRAEEPAALEEAPRLPPRKQEPPPPPAQKGQPKRFVLTVTARREAIKLFDSNALDAAVEIIGVAAGDQTLVLGVNRNYPGAAVKMYLPEGTHRYVISARASGWLYVARQRVWKEYFASGDGELAVNGDRTFDVKRDVSREGGYKIRLQPR